MIWLILFVISLVLCFLVKVKYYYFEEYFLYLCILTILLGISLGFGFTGGLGDINTMNLKRLNIEYRIQNLKNMRSTYSLKNEKDMSNMAYFTNLNNEQIEIVKERNECL
jgi:hypothetical protein